MMNKLCWLALLLLIPVSARLQALFVEANFSDQQHSALVENISLRETDLRTSFSGFSLFLTRVKVLDVFFGDLDAGDEIEIQLNVAYFGRDNTLKHVEGTYILSFCESADGVYYTNRDYLVIAANEINIAEFERLRREGTDFDGNHDCTSTNFDLPPIKNLPK